MKAAIQILAVLGALATTGFLIVFAPLSAFGYAMSTSFAPPRPREPDIRGYLLVGAFIGVPIVLGLFGWMMNSMTRMLARNQSIVIFPTMLVTHLIIVGYYSTIKSAPPILHRPDIAPFYYFLPWVCGIVAGGIIVYSTVRGSSRTEELH
jgi:hypothetical protein